MISSWERVGPNVIPHVAKATGIYLNSMLATTEARRAGYDEAIMLSHDGYIADGPGENIFVVKDGVLRTLPLAMSILPGITRDTIIQIAQDLGYRVEETLLIRTDLYLADEVFMVGTATEVAPLRAIDDREIGVGPVTRELQSAYLETVHGRSERWSQWRDVVEMSPLRVVAATRTVPPEPVARRAGGGADRGGPTVRAALARAHDRPLRGGVRRDGRRAVRSGGLERHRGSSSAVHRRRRRPRRRGRHLALLVRRLRELRDLRGATPVFADVDRQTFNLDPRAVEAAMTDRTRAVVAVDIYGYPCELDELRALCRPGSR